jgi:hypothetical protein
MRASICMLACMHLHESDCAYGNATDNYYVWCVVSEHLHLHAEMNACPHMYMYTYIQAYIHKRMHTYIHTCVHTLHVPAQASPHQQPDDAACGHVPGPHVASAAVRGLLLHATWAHACVCARVMAEHTATMSCVPRTDGQRAETHTTTPQHSLVYVRVS